MLVLQKCPENCIPENSEKIVEILFITVIETKVEGFYCDLMYTVETCFNAEY